MEDSATNRNLFIINMLKIAKIQFCNFLKTKGLYTYEPLRAILSMAFFPCPKKSVTPFFALLYILGYFLLHFRC